MIVLYPNAINQVEDVVSLFLEGFATESVTVIKENLVGPRSGRKYPNLPNRSSSQYEYPAYQFGDLFDSVGNRKIHKLEFEIGSILNPPDHAYYLELNLAGTAPGTRPWLDPTYTNPTFHPRMIQAGMDKAR
jgi:hypothetical protein